MSAPASFFERLLQDSRKQYFVLDNTLEIPDDVQELNFSKSGIIISEEDFLSKTFEGYVLNCSSVFSREIVEFCLAIKDYFFLGKSINIDSLLKKMNNPYFNPLNPRSFEYCTKDCFNIVDKKQKDIIKKEKSENLYIFFLRIENQYGIEIFNDDVAQCKELLENNGFLLTDLQLRLFLLLFFRFDEDDIIKIQNKKPYITKTELIFELYSVLFGDENFSNEYEIIVIEQLRIIINGLEELKRLHIRSEFVLNKQIQLFDKWEHALSFFIHRGVNGVKNYGNDRLKNCDSVKNAMKDLLRNKKDEELINLFDFLTRLNDGHASYTNEKDFPFLSKLPEVFGYLSEYPPLTETQKKCEKLAEAGDAVAQLRLGELYCSPCGTSVLGQFIYSQNYSLAYKWLKKSAELGNPEAMYRVGFFLLNKEMKTSEDIRTAIQWIEKSAELGNSQAQYSLGICYELGRYVEKDCQTALYWYKKSSEHDCSDAQRRLGLFYFKGELVKKDFVKARELFEKSGTTEDSFVLLNLGLIYRDGKGIKQDYKKAARCFLKSAEQGNVIAQWCLAGLYLKGNGTKQNFLEAKYLYEIAAENGIADAQYQLGLMYFKGIGVTQNYMEGLNWLIKSAKAHYLPAIAAISFLSKIDSMLNSFDNEDDWNVDFDEDNDEEF